MKYYIIAGEASGDLHGSNLMKGLYAQDPQADIRYWGGPRMTAVHQAHQALPGLVHDYNEGAVMGFWEVLTSSRKLLRRIHACEQDLLRWQPDVVILIDYPGFNFRIAAFAHRAGYKVFYYIAPKVWASRERRVRALKAHVDRLFIVFPFEIPYFRRKGVPFIYKGNPLIDAIDGHPALQESRADFLARTGLPDRPFFALLAGSRKHELGFMLPRLGDMADRLHADPRYAGWQFVVAGAPARTPADYRTLTEGRAGYVRVVFGETYGVLRHAEAAVVNSGTASLEAALVGTPQMVGYGSSGITFAIGYRIIRVPYISLANLILDRALFREFIQYHCTGENLVAEARRLVEDEAYRSRMLSGYGEVRAALGGRGASRAVAQAMVEELSKG